MQTSKKVSIFAQCLIDAVYPEVGKAVENIFKRLNIPVDCPEEQTCCGQPAFNSGFFSEAGVAARHFIEVFENSEQIVCPSGSCVYMVRHHYPKLFKDQTEWLDRARNVGQKTFELSEYLVDILGVEDLGAQYNGKVTIHDSCHALRGLGIHDQPRKLMNKVQGLQLVEMNDSERCCGFGGVFSVKYPEISTAMVEDKVQNILESGVDTVIGVDMSCLMNIQGRLSRMKSDVRVMHLAQILENG